MIALYARYDGKVIVPEAPLNLPTNQRIRIHLELIAPARTNFREWIGLGAKKPQNPAPRFPDDDSLWL